MGLVSLSYQSVPPECSSSSRLAYVSFDAVPAPKGAATHIEAFARSLAHAFGGIDLVTVATGSDPVRSERWPGVMHAELPALGETLIDRVLCFRQFLRREFAGRRYNAIHFRSIFEGLPLLDRAAQSRLIFEVNGLPSIELKYRYPGVEDDRELMRKLLSQEQACLDAAHLIVTPSGVTRDYLISTRAVAPAKIRVIPNGVDIQIFQAREAAAGSEPFRMLYFGTLSSWQGVELGIRALAQVRVELPAALTIIGMASNHEKDALLGLAAKLGVAADVTLLPPMPQADLASHLRASDAVIAPLTLNDRNLVQGCCPLKVLEGMAAAVPVIASDLPVVRELGCDNVHFLLVKAGSVDQIAQAVLRLSRDPDLAANIGRQGRAHILENYTWERSCGLLAAAYEDLGISRSRIN